MKKVLGVVLALILWVGILPLGTSNCANAGDADFKEPGNDFKYDSKSYSKYVARKKVISVYEKYILYHLGIGKGDLLGTAEIRTYILVSKGKRADGEYHKIIAYECEMNPRVVSSKHSIRSVAEYAYVGINTENASSRVCSPTASQVVTTNDSSTKTSKSLSFGVQASSGKNAGKSVEASGSIATEASRSMTYQSNGITLTQYKNDNGRAGWMYNYIPRGNVEVDAWVASTTYTSGMVDYVTASNSSMTGVGVTFYADIRFGAQWYSGNSAGTRIYDGSLSWKNWDLGKWASSFTMYY